jgi:hypothetical protein
VCHRIEQPAVPARRAQRGSRLLRTLRTTGPKDIGIHYLMTAFAFFLVGGAMALLTVPISALPLRAEDPPTQRSASPNRALC